MTGGTSDLATFHQCLYGSYKYSGLSMWGRSTTLLSDSASQHGWLVTEAAFKHKPTACSLWQCSGGRNNISGTSMKSNRTKTETLQIRQPQCQKERLTGWWIITFIMYRRNHCKYVHALSDVVSVDKGKNESKNMADVIINSLKKK